MSTRLPFPFSCDLPIWSEDYGFLETLHCRYTTILNSKENREKISHQSLSFVSKVLEDIAQIMKLCEGKLSPQLMDLVSEKTNKLRERVERVNLEEEEEEVDPEAFLHRRSAPSPFSEQNT